MAETVVIVENDASDKSTVASCGAGNGAFNSEGLEMNMTERLLRHDASTTRNLLDRSLELTDEQLDREFDIGHRSLRRTFLHIIGNMECWCDLMAGQPQQTHSSPGGHAAISDLIVRLDAVAAKLLVLGKRVVDERRGDDFFVDYLDKPPRRKPLGAGLLHVATHGMHHRAQCLYLMRLLGMTDLPEGDPLSWDTRRRGSN